jgi:hypothetical protein
MDGFPAPSIVVDDGVLLLNLQPGFIYAAFILDNFFSFVYSVWITGYQGLGMSGGQGLGVRNGMVSLRTTSVVLDESNTTYRLYT